MRLFTRPILLPHPQSYVVPFRLIQPTAHFHRPLNRRLTLLPHLPSPLHYISLLSLLWRDLYPRFNVLPVVMSGSQFFFCVVQ